MILSRKKENAIINFEYLSKMTGILLLMSPSLESSF